MAPFDIIILERLCVRQKMQYAMFFSQAWGSGAQIKWFKKVIVGTDKG